MRECNDLEPQQPDYSKYAELKELPSGWLQLFSKHGLLEIRNYGNCRDRHSSISEKQCSGGDNGDNRGRYCGYRFGAWCSERHAETKQWRDLHEPNQKSA